MANRAPPKKPSHDFFGEMRSNSFRLPKKCSGEECTGIACPQNKKQPENDLKIICSVFKDRNIQQGKWYSNIKYT